MKGKMIKTDKD